MGITLVADRLGSARFGFAIRQPVTPGLPGAGLGPRKIRAGERFEYYGDPDDPPPWASPVDEAGRAMYAKADQTRSSEASAALAKARNEVKRLQAEVATEPANVLAVSNAHLATVRAEIARQEAALAALPEPDHVRAARERAARVAPEADLRRLRADEKRLQAAVAAEEKRLQAAAAKAVSPQNATIPPEAEPPRP